MAIRVVCNFLERMPHTTSEFCKVFLGVFACENLDIQSHCVVGFRCNQNFIDIFPYEIIQNRVIE